MYLSQDFLDNSTEPNSDFDVAKEDELLYQDMLDYGPDMIKLQSWFKTSRMKGRYTESRSNAGHEKRMAGHEKRTADHEKRMADHKKRMADHEKRMADHKARFNNFLDEIAKVDYVISYGVAAITQIKSRGNFRLGYFEHAKRWKTEKGAYNTLCRILALNPKVSCLSVTSTPPRIIG